MKTKHKKRSSRANAADAPARRGRPDPVTERSRVAVLVREGTFTPRPSHWRYLRAYSELLEEGPVVTYAAIAKRMGISRERLWRIRRRWTGLDAWVSEQLTASNQTLVGPVVRKMAMLGLRGSREHAELFLKHAAGVLGGDSTTVNVQTAGPTVIKLALPDQGDTPRSADPRLLEQKG